MSQSFLVVAADPVIGSLVGELVSFAGHRPRYLRDDESAASVIRKRPPFGVLLDASKADQEVNAVVRAAREQHVQVVYFASSMSSAELRAYAEQRRAPWFALPNGPKLVGVVLADAIALADSSSRYAPFENVVAPDFAQSKRVMQTDLGSMPPAMTAALVATQRAQFLVSQAELVRHESSALRRETSELLAEANASRSALRDAVRGYAVALRARGVSARDAQTVVKTLLFESAVTVSDEHTADDVALESLDWVSEVYAA